MHNTICKWSLTLTLTVKTWWRFGLLPLLYRSWAGTHRWNEFNVKVFSVTLKLWAPIQTKFYSWNIVFWTFRMWDFRQYSAQVHEPLQTTRTKTIFRDKFRIKTMNSSVIGNIWPFQHPPVCFQLFGRTGLVHQNVCQYNVQEWAS